MIRERVRGCGLVSGIIPWMLVVFQCSHCPLANNLLGGYNRDLFAAEHT